MRTKTICKKTLSAALVIGMLTFCSIPALADDTTVTGTNSATSTMTASGSIAATTISITHPASVNYTIDPNSKTFTAPDITIKNNSSAAVVVAVTSLKANPGTTTTIGFTDVLPVAKDWANLNTADSKTYIALGIKASTTGWSTGYNTATHYAADISSFQVGTLAAGKSAALNLVANFGYAYNMIYYSSHSIGFSFTLA